VAGTVICQIGEFSFEGYLIISGVVEVRSAAGKVLVHADAGSIVGELSMLGLVTQRTCELVAVDYVEAYCVHKDDLFRVFEDDGLYMHEVFQMKVDIIDLALSRYEFSAAPQLEDQKREMFNGPVPNRNVDARSSSRGQRSSSRSFAREWR
jgi:hypothetical protein